VQPHAVVHVVVIARDRQVDMGIGSLGRPQPMALRCPPVTDDGPGRRGDQRGADGLVAGELAAGGTRA